MPIISQSFCPAFCLSGPDRLFVFQHAPYAPCFQIMLLAFKSLFNNDYRRTLTFLNKIILNDAF